MSDDPSAKQIRKLSQYLFRKLRGFYALTEQIETAIGDLCKDVEEFTPRQQLISQGDAYRHMYLIESGWVLRARHLAQGTRQLVNVAMPGDFACFNAHLFGTSDYDLVAKTPVTAFRFEPMALVELFAQYPHLAVALTWANGHEESMLAERVVSLGRRNARERLAHVLCELASRMQIVGLTGDNMLSIPLTQEDFGDLLGMSLIHVNRTLRGLAAADLVHYKIGQVQILDFDQLARVAGFDSGYLHFTQRSDILPR